MIPVSDAVFLSSLVDGVVLVVNGQETPRDVVKEARLRLSYARAKILGVVLNRGIYKAETMVTTITTRPIITRPKQSRRYDEGGII